MHIAFLDLRRDIALLSKEEILSDINRIIDEGVFIGGASVEHFENTFAECCGASYAIGCGNGLDALYLCLRAAGVGAGDEVIVPGHTFVATWLAVSRTGATIVPVDVREDTGCIDEHLLQDAVSERTRAIIVVHLYGHIPDMDAITTVAANGSIVVIEDAAQAHGAVRNGRVAGSFGRLAAFSFYPTKNLGAWGDAGAVTTSDEEMAIRVRVLRNYGRESREHSSRLGVNSRLDPIQAAVLCRKLDHLDEINHRKKRIAERYDRAIGKNQRLQRMLKPNANCVWHQYVVVADDQKEFREHMSAHGVGVDVHYPVPPYRQACYAHLDFDPGLFPVSENLARQTVSLPIGSYLNDREVEHVCETIGRFD